MSYELLSAKRVSLQAGSTGETVVAVTYTDRSMSKTCISYYDANTVQAAKNLILLLNKSRVEESG